MTKTYGIKVSRPGFDVFSARPNELSFNSQYKTLKVHTAGSGSLTDSSRTVTIPHNLGYVPVFMVHNTMDAGFGSSLFSSSDYVLSPSGLGGVLADPSAGYNDDLFAYADSTNLYIKAQENFGKKVITTGNQSEDECYAGETSAIGYNTGFWVVGEKDGVTRDGAIRFENMSIAQGTTIYKATLNIYIQFHIGTGEVRARIYGIDEDDTDAFNTGTAATARSKTTAYSDSNSTVSAGSGVGTDVTAVVQEILNRGGWTSGNNIGFIMNNNVTTSNSYYEDDNAGLTSARTNIQILISNTIASYKYTIFKNQLE